METEMETEDYFSARIQSMVETKSNFDSEQDFLTEHSKIHWSDFVTAPTEFPREVDQDTSRKYFEELKSRQDADVQDMAKDSPGFFRDMDDLVIGQKLGEGGQAWVYEAGELHVLKIFKGARIQDFHEQWTSDMLAIHKSDGALGSPEGATLLKDERFLNKFALLMCRHWGDLRSLIDSRMRSKWMFGRWLWSPPFDPQNEVSGLILWIARDMHSLHTLDPPFLYRDLKASNVLLRSGEKPSVIDRRYQSVIVDYECTTGLQGTKFWNAPEILRHKGLAPDSCFSKESDVYAFGMTCYEILTGRIPFEGEWEADISAWVDRVLKGHRPKLPRDLDPLLREMITSCWRHEPSKRPNFKYIVEYYLKATVGTRKK